MIACHNIRLELYASVEGAERGAKPAYPIIFLPRECHLFPDKLRTHAQALLDNIENVDYILMPMGRCGNGVIGLVHPTARLVLPNCQDCIDLLLSNADLGKHTERPTYSYFLTEGWLGNKTSIDTEFNYTLNKYGEETGKEIIKMIYANYKDFSIVNTGCYNIEKVRAAIAPLAETTEMNVSELPGPFGVLKKMVNIQIDRNFVVVPPGEPVSEEHFRACAMAGEGG
jgi:hypothetical protein